MKAQLVVSDPAATQVAAAGWSKSLAEAAAQSKALMDSKALLQQSVDLFSKVASAIHNVQAVRNIIDRQVSMVKLLNKELSRNDIADLDSYRRYISILQNVVVDAQSTISMLNSFLNPSVSMSPGDRIKLILELDKQSREQYATIRTKIQLFDKLNTACRILIPTSSNHRRRSK